VHFSEKQTTTAHYTLSLHNQKRFTLPPRPQLIDIWSRFRREACH